MDGKPEIRAETIKPQAPLWKRVRAWTLISLIYAVIAGMAVAGVVLLWRGLRPSVAIDDRILHVAWAIALLFIPVHIARTFLRTRWTTGRWTMSREARAQQVSQCRVRNNGSKPITPYPWLHFAIGWSIYSATEAFFPLWRRMLSWFVITAAVVALLGITGVGLIFIDAGLGTFRSLGWLMTIFGLGLLLLPAAVVWPFIRHKRETGSWRTQPQEMQEIKARQNLLRDRGRRQPLRTKIFSTTFCAVILGAWWARDTVYHAQHPHESWVEPAFVTLFAVYGTWSQFRKPKDSQPQDSDSPSALHS